MTSASPSTRFGFCRLKSTLFPWGLQQKLLQLRPPPFIGIDHGRADVSVTEQFLDRANIMTGFKPSSFGPAAGGACLAPCGAATPAAALSGPSVLCTPNIRFPFAIVKEDSEARGACQQAGRKKPVPNSLFSHKATKPQRIHWGPVFWHCFVPSCLHVSPTSTSHASQSVDPPEFGSRLEVALSQGLSHIVELVGVRQRTSPLCSPADADLREPEQV